jgi:hypothetical protein
MKNFSKLFGGIVLCSNILAHPVCTNFWGGTACGSGKVDSLESQGVVNITGTEVVGKTNVQGSFNVKKATLNIVEVHGSTAISDSRVLGKSTLLGSLEATNTSFENNIDIHSDNMSFNSCQIGLLSVTSKNRPGKVMLTGNTKANKIVFNQAGGEVWLYDDAKVVTDVVGGKIVKK